MLDALAQATTQPAAWRTFTAQDWVLLIGAVAAAVATVLSAWAKYQASKAEKKADKSQDTANSAAVDAAKAKTAAFANTGRIADVSRKQDVQSAATTTQLSAIALAVNPKDTPTAPTPESIISNLASQPPENQP
jgi:hypothetical protein